jgi:hypothetical protein
VYRAGRKGVLNTSQNCSKFFLDATTRVIREELQTSRDHKELVEGFHLPKKWRERNSGRRRTVGNWGWTFE